MFWRPKGVLKRTPLNLPPCLRACLCMTTLSSQTSSGPWTAVQMSLVAALKWVSTFWICVEHLLLSWAVREHPITVFFCKSLDSGFHLFPGESFLAKSELSSTRVDSHGYLLPSQSTLHRQCSSHRGGCRGEHGGAWGAPSPPSGLSKS